jgi:hypothetical protein
VKGTLLWLLLRCAVFAQGQLPPRSVPIQDPSDSKRGRPSGEVRDENGNPVPNAIVKATPHGVISMTILPHTRTDAQGRFAPAGLLPVRPHVNADKEEAFYPDASPNFWDDPGAAEVEVPAGGEVSGLTIKLTPAGRLNVRAKNAITGEPVDAITVHLERVGSPNRSISGSILGKFVAGANLAGPRARPGQRLPGGLVRCGRRNRTIRGDHPIAASDPHRCNCA